MQAILLPYFNNTLWGMAIAAAIFFVVLFFINAGYGAFRHKYWGPTIPNKVGWILMEIPVVLLFVYLFSQSDRLDHAPSWILACIFLSHYVNRTFIFPFLMRGKSRIPFTIVLLGITFNTFNTWLQGSWLFYIVPKEHYSMAWFYTPMFLIGIVLFFGGMFINIQSDKVIRNLRAPGDTKHYMPKTKMFRWVSSANYFGECLEWLGFAVLTWSPTGLVFFLWTFANLAPRAIRINKRYREQFPEDFDTIKPKAIIPFVW